MGERVLAYWNAANEKQLQRIIDEMRSAWHSQDAERLFELDTKFHRLLYAIADHSILLEIASGLRARMDRFLYEANVVYRRKEELGKTILSHTKLLESLKSRDLEAVRCTIEEHINAAKERILLNGLRDAKKG